MQKFSVVCIAQNQASPDVSGILNDAGALIFE